MKPLILFTAMTVIGIIGIIEYSYAEPPEITIQIGDTITLQNKVKEYYAVLYTNKYPDGMYNIGKIGAYNNLTFHVDSISHNGKIIGAFGSPAMWEGSYPLRIDLLDEFLPYNENDYFKGSNIIKGDIFLKKFRTYYDPSHIYLTIHLNKKISNIQHDPIVSKTTDELQKKLNTCKQQYIENQIILNNTINNFNNLTLFYGTLNTEFTALETNFNIQSNDFNTCNQERKNVKQELNNTRTEQLDNRKELETIKETLKEKEKELTETKANYTKVKQELNNTRTELTETKAKNKVIVKYLNQLNTSLNTHTAMTTEYIDTQIIDKTQTNNYYNFNTIFGYISSKINLLQGNVDTCKNNFEQLGIQFDTKNSTKNIWKERWKTCFDKKENLKTELNYTNTN